MDRAALSEESIHELGALFEAAVREAVTALSVADLDGLERRLQAMGRQVMGQVVERVLAVRAAQEGMEREPCAYCGGAMRRGVSGAGTTHPGCGGRLHAAPGLRPVRRLSLRAGSA